MIEYNNIIIINVNIRYYYNYNLNIYKIKNVVIYTVMFK